jgi:lipoprotein-releasing system permease protein
MAYPLQLALRYMGSKKRAFISIGTAFAMIGVTLGVAALAIVMSVTGGFQEQFREKVLGVNAHVLVLKYSIDFREYRDIMKRVEHVPGVVGVAPFVINPMMVTHGERTATGVLLKGVDPDLMPRVLDLPKHIVDGSLTGLRKEGARPPERKVDSFRWDLQSAYADAGTASEGGSPLLDVIRKQIEDDDRMADAGGAPGQAPEPEQATGSGLQAPATSGVEPEPRSAKRDGEPPLGSTTPDGGFTSKLPDTDELPDFIDPDPCKSPEQVAKLPGVVVGKTLTKTLNIGIGDCVQVTSPTIGLSLGASGARPPVAKQFRVIAVFEAGFDQYDSKLVYTDLYEAQAFYEYGDSVTGVEMKVDDIDNARKVALHIDKLLANSIYHTMDWKELNHGLFTALLIQQIGMSLVLALIIVVAAFTVIATLIMVVLDKKKEIALLKALGAKDSEVLRIFLYQGGIIGAVGTACGLLLGLACCKGLLAYGFPLDPKVYFISRLPVNVRPTEFLITGAVAVAICLVATLFPALYASKLRPSDGLRAE